MSKPTYSVGTTALRPHNPFTTATVTLPDTSASGVSCAGMFTVQQGLMTQGDEFLVLTADGSVRRARLNAERSRPGVLFVDYL